MSLVGWSIKNKTSTWSFLATVSAPSSLQCFDAISLHGRPSLTPDNKTKYDSSSGRDLEVGHLATGRCLRVFTHVQHLDSVFHNLLLQETCQRDQHKATDTATANDEYDEDDDDNDDQLVAMVNN